MRRHKYLYLFDLETMEKNFHIRKTSTEGLTHYTQLHPESMSENCLRYASQPLGYEWRVYGPIDVDKYCIGILEHWNHMRGIIGKGSVDGAMRELAIDLMQYKGELRK